MGEPLGGSMQGVRTVCEDTRLDGLTTGIRLRRVGADDAVELLPRCGAGIGVRCDSVAGGGSIDPIKHGSGDYDGWTLTSGLRLYW